MRTVIRNSYTPQIGDYCNHIVIDKEKDIKYIFDRDGVYTVMSLGKTITSYDEYREGQKDTDVFSTGAVVEGIDSAVTALEEEIQEVRDHTDVVDIVGTYADLQAYDTSTLGDNDIIKVIADETHDGATTYYRWDKDTSTWEYIGEQGPYYTKDETDGLLADKQDTLTAGTGISIDADNVISATSSITTDSALSFTSTNPVENQAIKNAIFRKYSSTTKEHGVDINYADPYSTTNYVNIGTDVAGGTRTNSSVAIGRGATNAIQAVSIGPSAKANGRNSVVIGHSSEAAQYSVAIGTLAKAYAADGTVYGYSCQVGANATESTAIGHSASAQGSESVAIGHSAKIDNGVSNSVAIGHNAEADESDTVSVGNSSSSVYRRVVNVADAINAHDAITKNQFDTAIGNIEALLAAI